MCPIQSSAGVSGVGRPTNGLTGKPTGRQTERAVLDAISPLFLFVNNLKLIRQHPLQEIHKTALEILSAHLTVRQTLLVISITGFRVFTVIGVSPEFADTIAHAMLFFTGYVSIAHGSFLLSVDNRSGHCACHPVPPRIA